MHQAMEKGELDEVRDEIVKLILKNDRFDYKTLIGSLKAQPHIPDIIDKINELVEMQKQKASVKSEDLKVMVFDNPLNVRDDNINDILDAFVNMRNPLTLSALDQSSLSGVLTMFNQWIRNEINAPGQSILAAASVAAQPAVQNPPTAELETVVSEMAPQTMSQAFSNMYVSFPQEGQQEGPGFSYMASEMQMTYGAEPQGPSAFYASNPAQEMYRPRESRLYNTEVRFVGPDSDEKR